jgi:hypothetical protein
VGELIGSSVERAIRERSVRSDDREGVRRTSDLRFEQLVHTSAFVVRASRCVPILNARTPFLLGQQRERRERMVGIIQCSREQHAELFDHSRHDSC